MTGAAIGTAAERITAAAAPACRHWEPGPGHLDSAGRPITVGPNPFSPLVAAQETRDEVRELNESFPSEPGQRAPVD
jgi:hypothetical protein